MKNYALLDENDLVINISIADSNWDSTGWVEYTGKNCGIGFTYNADLDLFIEPEPEGHIGFDESTGQWIMPKVEIETLAE